MPSPTSKCLAGVRFHSEMTCGTCASNLPCRHPYLKDRPICLYGAQPTNQKSRCSAVVDDENGDSVFCWSPSLENMLADQRSDYQANYVVSAKEKKRIQDILNGAILSSDHVQSVIWHQFPNGDLLSLTLKPGDGNTTAPVISAKLVDEDGHTLYDNEDMPVYPSQVSVTINGRTRTLHLIDPNGCAPLALND